MKLRSHITYIICFVFALFAFTVVAERQGNTMPRVEAAAKWESIEKTATSEAARVEKAINAPSESVHLQPQWRIQAARMQHAAKTFLLSRYLSYLDDSFTLHRDSVFTHAVAYNITAYRFLLTFPKHWFW